MKRCALATTVIAIKHDLRMRQLSCIRFVSMPGSCSLPSSPFLLQIRETFHIICEGDNLPPPLLEFTDMRMPPSILRYLVTKNIRRPTPIQMQARQSSPQQTTSCLFVLDSATAAWPRAQRSKC